MLFRSGVCVCDSTPQVVCEAVYFTVCVCVWEDLCSERDPLRLLHHWDATVTGCRGLGGRLTLSPRGDRLFMAYGRANVKILDWRAGEECVCVCSMRCVCVCVCVVAGGSEWYLIRTGGLTRSFRSATGKHLGGETRQEEADREPEGVMGKPCGGQDGGGATGAEGRSHGL